ncbi:MAG: aminotransferase class IV [Candidatus Latescibacterota bacterium]
MNPDIWINGKFIPWNQATIHPFCHSLQRGATIFESLDCNEADTGRAAIFRLRDHIHRFEISAEIIGIHLPYSPSVIEKAVIDTVARSGLKKCCIRPLAFYADPSMDLYPGNLPVSVMIGVGEFHPSSDMLKATIGRLRKIDSSCMPVKAKVSGNYITPLLAKSEAIKAGYDDAILLDHDGYIAEASTANIFIVEKGKLVTSPDDTVLLGVTRDSIIVLSKKLGIEVSLERYGTDRLFAADEVILCSSGNMLKPIIQVDNHIIGNGGTGPVIARLRDFYSDVVVGKVSEFEHWLTYV